MIVWEQFVQYGFAGVALAMLYTIATNKLDTIQTTLVEIRTVLESIAGTDTELD